jgi:hypothetical protein
MTKNSFTRLATWLTAVPPDVRRGSPRRSEPTVPGYAHRSGLALNLFAPKPHPGHSPTLKKGDSTAGQSRRLTSGGKAVTTSPLLL